jgi:SAM-dependent methyltransferase
MSDREGIHERAERFFEELWRKGDQWEFDSSEYERERIQRLRDAISDRRYERALELGCGAGHFTRLLAAVADRTLALDIAPAAIEEARRRGAGPGTVEYRVANIMEYEPRADAPFDLIALVETVYYIGWLYPFFDLAWLARELFEATRPGGRLLLSNTIGENTGDALLLPWVIRSYHDLFVNAGFAAEREETFRGRKHGVELEVLISVLERPLG